MLAVEKILEQLSHCVTRMRFVLGDESKADIDKIETLGSAKGTFTQGGQFQVILVMMFKNFIMSLLRLLELKGLVKSK